MQGKYIPYSDGYGIVGFSYECPKCAHVSDFRNCEQGCEKCGFNEPYQDPDKWIEQQNKNNHVKKRTN